MRSMFSMCGLGCSIFCARSAIALDGQVRQMHRNYHIPTSQARAHERNSDCFDTRLRRE
jgi:hypothetical protein